MLQGGYTSPLLYYTDTVSNPFIMALSELSKQRIADTLVEDFNQYLVDCCEPQISELLADAACRFLESELGQLDDELHTDLAVELIKRQYIGIAY